MNIHSGSSYYLSIPSLSVQEYEIGQDAEDILA